MFCRNCGSPIPENGRFCAKCGTKVEMNSMPVVNVNSTPTPVTSTMSYKEVVKIIQIILSVAVTIFAVLNLFAFFGAMEKGDNDSFFNTMRSSDEFSASWYGLLSSILSPLLILGSFKRDLKSEEKKKGIGYIGLIIVALIIMGINIAIVNFYKISYCEDFSYIDWKIYRGGGLVLYSVCCVWIPVLSVSKFVIDTIMWLIKNPTVK